MKLTLMIELRRQSKEPRLPALAGGNPPGQVSGSLGLALLGPLECEREEKRRKEAEARKN